MSVSTLWSGSFQVTAPVVAGETLYVAGQNSGVIFRVETSAQLTPFIETNGHPTALALDATSGEIFVADSNRQCILKCEGPLTGDEPPQLVQFLEQFEGRPFRGPSGLAFDANGELYFADGGNLGDTGLFHGRGGLYRTIQGKQQVVAMCPGASLAQPTGIACASNGCVYVCEQAANRVLRFAQRPAGVFHASVFVQLAGGFGPSAIAVSPLNGDIYIGKFDFAGVASEGRVAVFSPEGEEKGFVAVPGPEITGICFDATGRKLYVTERSNIYSVHIA